MIRLPRDDQKTLWEYTAAALLLVIFLVVAGLLLWPAGKLLLVLRLAKGYAFLWVILAGTWWLLTLLQRMFRLESDPPSSAYVFTNLGLSAFLSAGWSAFAALVVGSFLADSTTWTAIVLHLIGFLSSLVASVMVGAFYQGTLYKMVNGPLALISYILFAEWPALARAIYGWFFSLFGAG
jgi:hypothetical protein